MITKLIEVTNGPRNWGKFLVGRFDTEWERDSVVAAQAGRTGIKLLDATGWSPRHVLVLDMQTGEGAVFAPWGAASADLNDKHTIWVCPMFEPFLNWLYAQDLTTLAALPDYIDLPDAPFMQSGYRRRGNVR